MTQEEEWTKTIEALEARRDSHEWTALDVEAAADKIFEKLRYDVHEDHKRKARDAAQRSNQI